MKRLLWLSLTALLGGTQDLTAWGDHGHEIVARLAARKLTPNTKRNIVTILRKAGDDQLHLPALLGPVGAPQPGAATLAEAMARMATSTYSEM